MYKKTWIAIALFLIVFVVFVPSLNNQFISYDDPVYIVENEAIKGITTSNIKSILFETKNGLWIPLTFLSYSINHQISGINPWSYFLVNILLHSTNAVFLFFLLFYFLKHTFLFSNSNSEGPTPINKNIIVASFLGALFWGIHPLRVESVAWATERKDVLCGGFFILSILFYFFYKECTNSNSLLSKKLKWYWLSVLMFFLSLISKPMGVMLPGILVLYDLYDKNRNYSVLSKAKNRNFILSAIFNKIPYLILSLTLGFISFLAMSEGLISFEYITFSQRILNYFYAIYLYLFKTIFPVGLKPFYPFVKPISLSNPIYLFSTVAFLAFIILSLYLILNKKVTRKLSWICILIFTYIFMLIPVSGLFQNGPQAAADRFTYLPSIILSLLFSIFLIFIFNQYKLLVMPKRKKMFGIVVIVIFCFLLINTQKCQKIWKTDISYWSTLAETYPMQIARVHQALGKSIERTGNLKKAEQEYLNAVQIDTKYSAGYYSLGGIYYRNNKFDKAVEYYKLATRIKADQLSHIMLGKIFAQTNDLSKAIINLEIATRIDKVKKEDNIYLILADLYKDQGNLQQAELNLNKALEVDPSNDMAFNNLGMIQFHRSDLTSAVLNYKKALSLVPENIFARINLGEVYLEENKYDLAQEQIEAALQASPNCQMAKDFIKQIKKR
jgi:protein O-mannosyl-transferase